MSFVDSPRRRLVEETFVGRAAHPIRRGATFHSPSPDFVNKSFASASALDVRDVTAATARTSSTSGPTASDAPLGGKLKRSFDIAAAAGGLIVLAPVMLFIALLILVTMGRPVLFMQQRMGFGRSPFRCLKFRTMVSDAPERLARHLAENPEAAQMWRDTQKLKHDPRITWLGQILRKSSLDELPQLFNILRGEMSCVGPRPVLASELARYGVHGDEYARAKPGLTGIWQVSGRSNTTYAHRINCDRFYVRRWSFALDMMIVLRTIPAIMRFRDTA
jgi:exopolysaccharide production protein ExoY